MTTLLVAAAQPAAADEVADFYKGKTVTIVVGHEVGTGFDIYARVLQRHLRRHIPGNPGVVVQNMPGAGGIAAANWLYNAAPKDGTIMASFVYTVPFEPLMGNTAATSSRRSSPGSATWRRASRCAACRRPRASTPSRTCARRRSFSAAPPSNGALVESALAVRNLLGVKMKVVPGYKGTASIKIAITRGEVHGVCSVLMSTITSAWRDDYQSGNFRPIIQLSGRARVGPESRMSTTM